MGARCMIRGAGLLILFSMSLVLPRISIAETHGELRDLEFGGVAAWDSVRGDWVTPEAFWRSYMRRSDGRSWGSRDAYPPFEQVLENDTLIIELDTGLCLMEFYHSRWRRANDVRRWDPGFNEVGGCPDVFD